MQLCLMFLDALASGSGDTTCRECSLKDFDYFAVHSLILFRAARFGRGAMGQQQVASECFRATATRRHSAIHLHEVLA